MSEGPSAPGDARRARAWLRLAALALAIVAMLALARGTGLIAWLGEEAGFRAWVTGFGAAAVPIFIVAYAVLLALWVPGTFLSLAGAALWGPYGAIAINYAGAVLGAMLGFGIARLLGGDMIDRLARGRLHAWDVYRELLSRRGFETTLYMRLVPTPYNVVSYLAGLSPVRPLAFLLATAIGILPGSIAMSFLLGTVIEQLRAGDWTALLSLRVAGALALFAGATLIPTGVRRARARWGWFGGPETHATPEMREAHGKER